MIFLIRAKFSGSFFFTQRIFGAVNPVKEYSQCTQTTSLCRSHYSDNRIPLWFCHRSEDGRADHLILLIQNDQSMHLSSEANACHLALVRIFQKLPMPSIVCSYQSSGFCSDQPGCGKYKGYSRDTYSGCSLHCPLKAVLPPKCPDRFQYIA